MKKFLSIFSITILLLIIFIKSINAQPCILYKPLSILLDNPDSVNIKKYQISYISKICKTDSMIFFDWVIETNNPCIFYVEKIINGIPYISKEIYPGQQSNIPLLYCYVEKHAHDLTDTWYRVIQVNYTQNKYNENQLDFDNMVYYNPEFVSQEYKNTTMRDVYIGEPYVSYNEKIQEPINYIGQPAIINSNNITTPNKNLSTLNNNKKTTKLNAKEHHFQYMDNRIPYSKNNDNNDETINTIQMSNVKNNVTTPRDTSKNSIFKINLSDVSKFFFGK